jgi:hemolysin III
MVWGLAIAGIALKVIYEASHPILSTALYLVMGWLAVMAVKPLLTNMPNAGLFLLIAGGLSYTVGVIFFAADSRIPYGHFIWHLFVITGTTCHYFLVLWYAA